ncbi:hypothetical protein NDR87_31450 [Nocardia sp. CDC159]|uniref:Head-to-tail adaptor n=1 Tax=Nocardia pulmonis TaxID=2951408 RepID=A0A9X2ECH3_9NOCA|nr:MULTISPECIES: hypothetical protein [Nocardia]MCM6777934.1 hypothetical protein [Nocardia pulmonis]MCM6790895.1 hypothetical protein [Nocardia sp. CDC159]
MSTCTWPVDRTCLPAVTAPEDQARLQSAVDTAVAVLWSFTGRQFGCCPITFRPCPREHDQGWPVSWLPGLALSTLWVDPVWREWPCGCGPRCTASGPGVVHLPGPVCELTGVVIDGAVVDESAYTLEGDRLYAASGRWPRQDLTVAAGSPGTWTVDYLRGTPPPAGADRSVALLAREFWNACTGEQKCQLPRRVESVVRQGVSVKMADPAAVFEDMLTGIPEVDLWIASVNPHRLSAPSAVSSPDYRAGV